jgi:hypothetical protein
VEEHTDYIVTSLKLTNLKVGQFFGAEASSWDCHAACELADWFSWTLYGLCATGGHLNLVLFEEFRVFWAVTLHSSEKSWHFREAYRLHLKC